MRLSWNELLRRVKGGERFSLYLFFGMDEFRKKQAIEELLQLLFAHESVGSGTERLHADDISADELVAKARSAPLFSDERAMVVFEVPVPDDPSKHKPIFTSRWAGRLIEYARSPSQGTFLILASEEKGIDRSNLFKVIEGSKSGVVTGFSGPSYKEARTWLEGEAKRMGKEMTAAAMETLIDLHGNDFRPLQVELEKLSLFIGSSPLIDETAVNQAAGFGRESSIYEVSESAVLGKRKEAIYSLERVLSRGVEPSLLLSVVLKEYLALLLSKASAEGYKRSGRPRIPDWKLDKFNWRGRNLPWEKVRGQVSTIFGAELELKSGKLDPELVLLLLLEELTKK